MAAGAGVGSQALPQATLYAANARLGFADSATVVITGASPNVAL